MQAGRELDALVASKVMGWKKIPLTPEMDIPWLAKELGMTWMWDKQEACLVEQAQTCPAYSTDIKAAWEITKGFRSFTLFKDGNNYHCYIHIGLKKHNRYNGQADTAPHAICLAALKAVGHETD